MVNDNSCGRAVELTSCNLPSGAPFQQSLLVARKGRGIISMVRTKSPSLPVPESLQVQLAQDALPLQLSRASEDPSTKLASRTNRICMGWSCVPTPTSQAATSPETHRRLDHGSDLDKTSVLLWKLKLKATNKKEPFQSSSEPRSNPTEYR